MVETKHFKDKEFKLLPKIRKIRMKIRVASRLYNVKI